MATEIAPGKYHDNFDHVKGTGYIDCLTEKEKEILIKFKELFPKERINFEKMAIPGESHDTLLLRYLRARDFDLQKATEMLEEVLTWREENSINAITERDPNEVLGMSLTELAECYPQQVWGVDNRMQPIFYRHLGKLDVKRVLRKTKMENFRQFTFWQYEKGNEILSRTAQDAGVHVETYLTVMDCEGVGWSVIMSNTTRSYLTSMASRSGASYPESNGGMILIKPPTLVSGLISLVKSVMDPVTASKIVVTHEPEKDLPKYMAPECIPVEYGGTGPSIEAPFDESTFYSYDATPIGPLARAYAERKKEEGDAPAAAGAGSAAEPSPAT